ncbi:MULTISPECIES: hypothetical protein [unclassified Nocardioides]|uniref:hypothetical protein n=1 Tax=unclassified Nocardioides TaxID=2615069 RepID=UPI0030153855
MRRFLGSVLALLTALGLVLAVAPPGRAADPLTGRLVSTDGGGGVAGVTLRLRRVVAGEPGAVVATGTTSADGSFSLDAGAAPDDEYYVQVAAGSHQGGYVGGSPRYVQPTSELAQTWGPSAKLGKVRANPAYLRGVLVDARTKRPVRGVRVAGGTQGLSPADTDVTDKQGRFVIRGITCEDDCYLRFRGRPRGYENGYRACGGDVVATWEDACASPLGRVGRVRIQRL